MILLRLYSSLRRIRPEYDLRRASCIWGKASCSTPVLWVVIIHNNPVSDIRLLKEWFSITEYERPCMGSGRRWGPFSQHKGGGGYRLSFYLVQWVGFKPRGSVELVPKSSMKQCVKCRNFSRGVWWGPAALFFSIILESAMPKTFIVSLKLCILRDRNCPCYKLSHVIITFHFYCHTFLP